MNYSLAESPTGIVHLVQVMGGGRMVTSCGRETNPDTWTRIRSLDREMFSKGRAQRGELIRKRLELPRCDRCF